MTDSDGDLQDRLLTSVDGSEVQICPTREPEKHYLGEFPMTCYRCHVEADS